MSKRILVVEDQEDNRKILRDLLTSADFEVIEAEDGESGLAAAAEHRPDLILRGDAQNQGRRGAAFHSRHRRHLLCVGGDDGKARAAGCDAYISKPYSPRHLLAMVREHLSAPTR